ncbi:MAG: methenyltetrahydromethanopterin cyclohydrolase [Pirellulales bacterium]
MSSSMPNTFQPYELELNKRTVRAVNEWLATKPNVVVYRCSETAGTWIDCGIDAPGGLDVGCVLALFSAGGLLDVSLVPARTEFGSGPAVQVRTDRPAAACMAAQYAGWKIAVDDFFAMGSGPMRLAYGKEALYAKLGWLNEQTPYAVGVLETRQAPPADVFVTISAACEVPSNGLTLLVAPTASVAGGVQIVARSVETAMHKLHELGFDLALIESGYGFAPLPPPAKSDLAAIGRTNDAILYGGETHLYVRCDDDLLAEFGPRVPSSASADYGRPFEEIFTGYDGDFYKIDPHLFSPAVVVFHNLKTGKTTRYGELRPDIATKSWS